MTRDFWFGAAVLIGAAAFAAFRLAPDNPLPDSSKSPGAVATTSLTEICARPEYPGSSWYSATHRVWHDKADTLRKYGISLRDARDYQDDDRVPVCLGGDNANPLNHWAQPIAQGRQKDRLEAELCRKVCRHEMSLKRAQAIFLGDWRPYLR